MLTKAVILLRCALVPIPKLPYGVIQATDVDRKFKKISNRTCAMWGLSFIETFSAPLVRRNSLTYVTCLKNSYY